MGGQWALEHLSVQSTSATLLRAHCSVEQTKPRSRLSTIFIISMSANRPIGVVPQAAENNKRLFRRYAKVISQEDGSDSDAYILHVLKLAAWLNSEKAYYSDARPEVCSVLISQLHELEIDSLQILRLLLVRSALPYGRLDASNSALQYS